MVLFVPHTQETSNDEDPVQVVRYDGTISGGVLPSEDCVEDTPSAPTIQFWVAKLDCMLGSSE